MDLGKKIRSLFGLLSLATRYQSLSNLSPKRGPKAPFSLPSPSTTKTLWMLSSGSSLNFNWQNKKLLKCSVYTANGLCFPLFCFKAFPALSDQKYGDFIIISNSLVASFLEGRQGDQCLHRYTQTLQMVRKGKWTEDEDAVRCHSRMAVSFTRWRSLQSTITKPL